MTSPVSLTTLGNTCIRVVQKGAHSPSSTLPSPRQVLAAMYLVSDHSNFCCSTSSSGTREILPLSFTLERDLCSCLHLTGKPIKAGDRTEILVGEGKSVPTLTWPHPQPTPIFRLCCYHALAVGNQYSAREGLGPHCTGRGTPCMKPCKVDHVAFQACQLCMYTVDVATVLDPIIMYTDGSLYAALTSSWSLHVKYFLQQSTRSSGQWL